MSGFKVSTAFVLLAAALLASQLVGNVPSALGQPAVPSKAQVAGASPEEPMGRLRPLFLELPEGSTGPCRERAPCQLIGMIDGTMAPAQMMREPGGPWRLWWYQNSPMVRGTKISAISGVQGGGHILQWNEESSGSQRVLSEKERPIVRFNPPSASTAPHHVLFSPDGQNLVTPEAIGLSLSFPGLDEPRARLVKQRGAGAGPIAGGHLLDIAWQDKGADGPAEVIASELRMMRVFVLSGDDYLVQIDSLLRPAGGEKPAVGGVPSASAAGSGGSATRHLRRALETPHEWRLHLVAPSSGGAPNQAPPAIQHLRPRPSVGTSPAQGPAAEEVPAAPGWVAQRRIVAGRPMTFVLMADPSRPPERLISDEQGLAMVMGPSSEATGPVRTALRVWVVDGWEVSSAEIQEQVDAFAGRSLEPTAEQLERRKAASNAPW